MVFGLLGLPVVSFTFFANLFIAYLVYRKNPRSITHILIAALALCMGLWAAFNYLALSPGPESMRLFWVRVVMFVTTPFGPLIFLLAKVFPQTKSAINKLTIGITAVFVLATAVLALSPYMFIKLENQPDGSFNLSPGLAIVLYAITLLGFMAYGFIILIKKYKGSVGLQKKQLSLFLTGIVVAFILMTATNFIAVVVFKTISLTFLGPTFTLIMVGFMAYAIIKHRFLDIKLIIARTIGYTLLVTLIAIFYVTTTFILSTLFFDFLSRRAQLIAYMALTILIALSFNSLRSVIEKVTDKIFFKGNYDSSKLLSSFGSIMSTMIELRPLSTAILQTLTSEMRISRGAIVLLEKEAIYDIIRVGFSKQYPYSYSTVASFLAGVNTVIFDELEEGNLKQLMRDLNIAIAHLLVVKGEIVGLLLLGEKASGEVYSEGDLRVLDIFSPELAIAIQNAKSYDKIQKFNITLQEEVQKATSDLKVANQKLKELDQLKDEFVSITSHELRTPMTVIRSYAWMALNKADIDLSDKMKKSLVRILISAERLINLVNDLLNVSRIEAQRIEISPRPLDLISLVKDIIDEIYYSKSTEKNIQFNILEQKLPEVFADPDKLRQVLLNLVGNSVKFTPPGGKIIFSFFTDGKVVETSVKDTGVGISQEDLGRLFTKFGRLDTSYVSISTSGGTGLGLYISKKLIELMHGKIWASSEGVGKGTTFTFSLPVASSEILQHADQFKIKPKGEIKGLEPVAI
ncbi:hypothetical protein HYS94_02345 [Candidatus Daviesbacteria bacterium]|nr:hypothetical protein [Candidatus Daviesbacteria bacterium]